MIKYGETDPYAYYDEYGNRYLAADCKELLRLIHILTLNKSINIIYSNR